MHLTLPDSKLLQKTSEVDYNHWNYEFPIKYIQRFRFKAILRLINGRNFGNILEIGTGSGIFLPELSKHCQSLSAIDIHDKMDAIKKMCDVTDVKVALSRESLESTHFRDEMFDAIVGVSVWEFVDDLERAVLETKRIMKPNASLFTICPQRNVLFDSIVSLYSGKSAKKEFKNAPDVIYAMLEKHFKVEKKCYFPPAIGRFLPLYHYYDFRKK